MANIDNRPVALQQMRAAGESGSKAGWYYRRLRSMSPPEIAFRVAEQVKRQAWRKYTGAWRAFDIGDGALPVLRDALPNVPPALREQIGMAAKAILDHPLEIFGQSWGGASLPQALAADPLLFHFDPVSRQHWPADTYCFDISYREPDGYGDYKFCAELNTLQFCQPLAVAACIDKSAESGQFVWQLWNAWYETNPPFRGLNWVSGVNIALRAVSLLVTALFLETDTAEIRRRMRALLNASAFWLDRYPSLHSSANNHLIAESVALFALGTLCPDFPGSRRYADTGRRRIEQHALRLILPDGVGAEMSPSYTAFAAEWLLLAAVIAKSAGEPFAPPVLDRLAAAAECLKWLMDDKGHVPSIGDNDNSCVIATGVPEPRYVASITAAIAGVTGRPGLSPAVYDLSLRDAIFAAPGPGPAQGDGIRHFEHGGLSVVRETRDGARSVLVFDHGPLGYLEIGAHGHADTLAIWLSVGGQPVLVDAGTYIYGGGPWREHFRSTAAHNTVEIAGTSSSVTSGPFNWSQKATGRLMNAEDHGDWSMEAEHDGYVSSHGRRHVRRLARTSSGFRIEDRLAGGLAPVRIGFLVHPDLLVGVDGHAVHLGASDRPVVSLSSLSGWAPQVIRGAEQPLAGWCSGWFGTKQPADRIVFSGAMGEEPIITDVVIHRQAR